MPFLYAFAFFVLWSDTLLVLWGFGVLPAEFALCVALPMTGLNLAFWMLLDAASLSEKFREMDREVERRHAQDMQRLIEEMIRRQKLHSS